MQDSPQAGVRKSMDVLIIGSGAAGLSLALHLAAEQRVAVLSKGPLSEGSTYYAQGGVSAVLDRHDSLEAHVRDTLDAGADLCDEAAVRHTVEHGPESIQWLLDLGVPFTREPGDDGRVQLHLTREGGHSHRRVVHAADATGKAIENTLVEQVRRHPNITLFEHHIAVDLLTSHKLGLEGPRRCLGAYVLNLRSHQVEIFAAPFVVLASGGASKVYLYSSNPDGSTGDGIAMAWRAGCRVANMEFMQFHPTCLFHPKAKSFLISEAVRGEGGRLLLPDGTPFMERFDPRGELAPRDIVARAIDHEMKRLGADCVYLDISHQPADFIKSHFPNIHERCLEYGFDMTRDPLPVVPAAHYTCGGVMTDLAARTDLAGLYAIGEVACTGLHGANRMASNSLLECLVFARSAAQDMGRQRPAPVPVDRIPAWDESRVTDSDEEVVVAHNWEELRRFMWDYVGIVRSSKRLQRAQRRIGLLQGEIHEYYSNFRVTNDLIELRNLALVAEIIIHSAQSRRESRGLHYTLDYPQTDPALAGKPTVLGPSDSTA
ncbi:L-aspartate oxidase [Ectothiorhodospira lacustris]|uniref:L-aspartate oxidase n=1 Tax=Ectothiorhodospira lacustris TaxID=2899127 RepID=UPI001EE814AA|nr:L-aspartate oxidase [Ectothiorhodospira lacustris]MCG5500539.1 L-aspartate oxidase [Ectothiorhodospira lacustris]MCG5509388.1 L-aspartate oxidase [Ectothiorhodospira lacustris]MCG5521442.1 L-aspartate oxidase [Ectothiorhodospira lacustris]